MGSRDFLMFLPHFTFHLLHFESYELKLLGRRRVTHPSVVHLEFG